MLTLGDRPTATTQDAAIETPDAGSAIPATALVPRVVVAAAPAQPTAGPPMTEPHVNIAAAVPPTIVPPETEPHVNPVLPLLAAVEATETAPVTTAGSPPQLVQDAVSPPRDVPDPAARPNALDRVADMHLAGVLWFAQTGHTLRGGFRALWERGGGLAQFGYPLSEEFQEAIPAGGKPVTVQYFERNRLEWHPEFAGTPNEFQLGLFGRESIGKAVFPISPPFGSSPTHVYFPQTQHSIGGTFLRYWQDNGGLALYGLPISEEILEQSRSDGRVYLVQYFERNRFELHPKQSGTPNEVQLGLLGTDILRKRGWLR